MHNKYFSNTEEKTITQLMRMLNKCGVVMYIYIHTHTVNGKGDSECDMGHTNVFDGSISTSFSFSALSANLRTNSITSADVSSTRSPCV